MTMTPFDPAKIKAEQELNINSTKIDTGEDKAPKEDTVEDKAREMGWRPKEDYKGEAPWVSAEIYIDRDSFYKKIAAQNRQLDELKGITQSLADSLTKSEKRAYEKALNDLKGQMIAAEASGDVQSYKHVNEQVQELNKQYQVEAAKPTQADTNLLQQPEFQKFIAQNDWFRKTDKKSKSMQVYATELSNEYALTHPGTTTEDELSYIHEEMRKEFSSYFSKDEDANPKVASVSGGGTRGKAPTNINKLTGFEKQTADYLESRGQTEALKVYLKSLEGK